MSVDLSNLHERALAIFEFICKYKIENKGTGPTTREMCVGVGLSETSVTTIRHHLKSLIRAGLIKVLDNIPRGIIVVGSEWIPPDGYDPPEYY